jgi:putative DNA modification/repair radical SAM protein
MYSEAVELQEKLSILASAAKYDASCASSGSKRSSASGLGATLPAGVCHSWTGDGRCVSLLKVLFSNACRLDCAYCANRASNDTPRAAFTPEEIARITISFYKRNYIEGLFLSSGIFSDPDIVMARLIETAKLLRRDHGFHGYIHLKAIPGCGDKLMREAALWADRLSANIELPSASSLKALAPQKDGNSILDSMRFLRDGILDYETGFRPMKPRAPFLPAGQSTQLIVGATEDSDASILSLANSLYTKMSLKRVYYSAYIPVTVDSRLPDSAPPLKREHRLYQADWLLRFYGFGIDDILESKENRLDLDIDPKVAWAIRHPEFFPVDLQTAEYERILRVPGIGLIGAQRLIAARRSSGVRSENLRKLGISLKRAGYFITVNGRRPIGTFNDQADLRSLLSDDASALRARSPRQDAPSRLLSASSALQQEFVFS